jgi:broad specificity phosphatase PhoE
MNPEKSWEHESWLSSAKNLIDWTVSTEKKSKLFLLVRHSHREVIEDHTAQLSTELTPLGREMSTEFGKHLPHNRAYKVFFSFVSRCYQTAEELVKGINENKGEVEEFDTIAILASPEIKDQSVWQELQPDGKNITDFINHWADGDFGEKIEPFDNYATRLKKELVERLQKDVESSLHVHITHDLALMAAKRMFLQRSVKWDDREPFLGGIGFKIGEKEDILFTAGSNSEHRLRA